MNIVPEEVSLYWFLPWALDEVCFPVLLGDCFRDNFRSGVFASRLNLNVQELHIFLECSSPAIQCLGVG